MDSWPRRIGADRIATQQEFLAANLRSEGEKAWQLPSWVTPTAEFQALTPEAWLQACLSPSQLFCEPPDLFLLNWLTSAAVAYN